MLPKVTIKSSRENFDRSTRFLLIAFVFALVGYITAIVGVFFQNNIIILVGFIFMTVIFPAFVFVWGKIYTKY